MVIDYAALSNVKRVLLVKLSIENKCLILKETLYWNNKETLFAIDICCTNVEVTSIFVQTILNFIPS